MRSDERAKARLVKSLFTGAGFVILYLYHRCLWIKIEACDPRQLLAYAQMLEYSVSLSKVLVILYAFDL